MSLLRKIAFLTNSLQRYNFFLTYARVCYIFSICYFLMTRTFESDEIEQLEQHNEEFRAQDSEEQLLPILFDVPAEGKGEFMTTAEISDKLVTYGGIKKPMNTRQLGILLKKKGFICKRLSLSGSTVRGWMVYQRRIDEIKLAKQTMTLG